VWKGLLAQSGYGKEYERLLGTRRMANLVKKLLMSMTKQMGTVIDG
jgi:hypothetical protein